MMGNGTKFLFHLEYFSAIGYLQNNQSFLISTAPFNLETMDWDSIYFCV